MPLHCMLLGMEASCCVLSHLLTPIHAFVSQAACDGGVSGGDSMGGGAGGTWGAGTDRPSRPCLNVERSASLAGGAGVDFVCNLSTGCYLCVTCLTAERSASLADG